jgi:hypothetical protein
MEPSADSEEYVRLKGDESRRRLSVKPDRV